MRSISVVAVIILLNFSFSKVFGQCQESTVQINITTDSYPHENSWSLLDDAGNLIQSASLVGEPFNSIVPFTVCVDSSACLTFQIEDNFGDGINIPGGFEVYMDSVLVVSNVSFTDSYSASFNCPVGSTCGNAESITEGFFHTIFDDHWYIFVPDSSGIYEITTCGLTSCDSKIWAYASCNESAISEDNTGTLFYNDSTLVCGEQADLSIPLTAGQVYYLRIGDDQDTCLDSINWSLNFQAYVMGCTDSTSCNFDPLATIDDGSCIAHGDPACPNAPDLVIDQDRLRTSLYLTTIDNNDDCLINEGCLQGYGVRDIVRFATRIDNIGDLDYYIGLESTDNDQFTYDNCHQHWHYDGYAEYLLFDENGQKIPIGFKNGFCVLDLGCTTGTASYDCQNMGISVGCWDEYWAELECQWVDITDITDGTYTLVTRVNWDNAPDLLGRIERDTLNNWAQACIVIDRSNGPLTVTQLNDCNPYTDCTGTLYGDAQIDCKGVCDGSALMGDLNEDLAQSSLDIDGYVEGILSGELTPTPCNDLSNDGVLDIYDLTLMASCLTYGGGHVHIDNGPHNHCNFPYNVISDDIASLEIVDFDPSAYVDIAIQNEGSRVIGYQFKMSGIKISGVESLIDTSEFDHPVQMDPLTNTVLSFSRDQQFIERNVTAQSLVRVYFSEITGDEICIESIQGIINDDLQTVPSFIEGNCVFISSTNQVNALESLKAYPNPTNDNMTVSWQESQRIFGWELTNLNGQQLVANESETVGIKSAGQIILDLEGYSSGLYFIKIRSDRGISILKLIKQ